MFSKKEKKILIDILNLLKRNGILVEDNKEDPYLDHINNILSNFIIKIGIGQFSYERKKNILEKTIAVSLFYLINIPECLTAIKNNTRDYKVVKDIFYQIINQIKAVFILEKNNLYSSQVLIIRNIIELIWLSFILLNDEDLYLIYCDSTIDEYEKWSKYFSPKKLRENYYDLLTTRTRVDKDNDLINNVFNDRVKLYRRLSNHVHNDYSTIVEDIYHEDLPIFIYEQQYKINRQDLYCDLVNELIFLVLCIEATVCNRKANIFNKVNPQMIYQTICRDYLLGFAIDEFNKYWDVEKE